MVNPVCGDRAKELEDVLFVNRLLLGPILALDDFGFPILDGYQVAAQVIEAFYDSLIAYCEAPSLVPVADVPLVVTPQLPSGLLLLPVPVEGKLTSLCR